ncbi:transporter substrate-binding domain-containing protein [Blastopirellula marina]|uniref:ABC transporter solute-binding protein-amino acid transport n=1 Tax=Blastopirellula marina DSM 3645 TaxID=314230 RepID=A3ZXX9_9BACT|nr:transporter substrate-binding domain-containing protein [Blastopirellula marina]EAQ78690.1 ABC transporter solute-binding protein-amino acid transport [Blastopirellula marina DSM 3645]
MKFSIIPTFLIASLGAALLTIGCAPADQTPQATVDKKSLTVAISPDIPPYVLDKATSGLEVELLRAALPDYELNFVQMPYEALEKAVPEKQAAISVGIRQENDNEFDSHDFIAFSNVAIVKKGAEMQVASVSDLGKYEVLTWQNAYTELGDQFNAKFAPGGPDHANYKEVADQKEQVEQFWKSDNAVIVIDRNIFDHFSKSLGHSLDAVRNIELFPGVTSFKVGFAEESLRDKFNDRLIELCGSGEYQKLLHKYQVHLPETPCDAK